MPEYYSKTGSPISSKQWYELQQIPSYKFVIEKFYSDGSRISIIWEGREESMYWVYEDDNEDPYASYRCRSYTDALYKVKELALKHDNRDRFSRFAEEIE